MTEKTWGFPLRFPPIRLFLTRKKNWKKNWKYWYFEAKLNLTILSGCANRRGIWFVRSDRRRVPSTLRDSFIQKTGSIWKRKSFIIMFAWRITFTSCSYTGSWTTDKPSTVTVCCKKHIFCLNTKLIQKLVTTKWFMKKQPTSVSEWFQKINSHTLW